jgi:HNH endonuclease
MATKQLKFEKKKSGYSDEFLNAIFEKTNGNCHLCGKKLVRKNYADLEARGCWEVEHSVAKANGGTDHLNNLWSACPPCNREKGAKLSSKQMRTKNGLTRAPLSKVALEKQKGESIKEGALFGSVVGSVFGPLGTVIGGVIGSKIGEKIAPKK